MKPLLPKKEGEAYQYQAFPAFCVSPSGDREIFQTEAEVPAGWTLPDGAKKAGKAEKAPAPVTAPVVAPVVNGDAPAVEVDASGTPWNEEIHRSTKSKNKAGLWHLKVGASRAPAPVLDL